jgi:predicted TIM-barrel fold metal-dependent hydrolase
MIEGLEATVVDADGHIREPADLWTDRFPPAMRDRAPRPVSSDTPFVVVDGVELPPRRNYAETSKNLTAWHEDRLAFAAADGFSPKSQLHAMDVEGIDASVLFPSLGLVIMGVDGVDPAVTTAAAHAYNDWLAEFCAEDPSRLFGAAMIDPRDIDGAITEARRAVEELGHLTVFIRPNPVNGLAWHDAAYARLWSALEELDVALCFHEGGAVLLPQVAIDRFAPHAFWHLCTHPMEQQMAMVSVLLGGVAERHPGLRFAFLECGAGWLPYWMWRMDEAVEGEESDFEDLSLLPSEYVERQCFVSIDTDEHTGIFTLDTLEQPRVVWGSDYPHHDGKFPLALETVTGLPGMSAARQRSVLHDAPLALFGSRLEVRATRS